MKKEKRKEIENLLDQVKEIVTNLEISENKKTNLMFNLQEFEDELATTL